MLWPLTFAFIVLHVPDGGEVLVVPEHITMMRAKPPVSTEPRIYVDDVRCSISLSDGKFVAVIETCSEVSVLIDRLEKSGGGK